MKKTEDVFIRSGMDDKKIRVLVADDSVFARELIIAILSTDKEIMVVGEAPNGLEAARMVRELRPNIVTMDIEMPVMDGLEAIEEIMANNAVPILVVTTKSDARTAYAAISKGALDLVVKPDVNIEDAQEFINKIKMLSRIKTITHLGGKRNAAEPRVEPTPITMMKSAEKVVAIASSTGGPDAISVILSSLPAEFPSPIVIAQHISDGFASGMVEWLKGLTRLSVKVGSQGEDLKGGVVYISPSEKHMMVTQSRTLKFAERHPKDIYRPSCDMLLTSVAESCGPSGIGVILTGMGTDGVIGIRKIKEGGGFTFAQDEGSSVVFGMPKAAIDLGCVDSVLPLTEMAAGLVRRLTVKSQRARV